MEKVSKLMYIDEVERVYYVREKEFLVGTKEYKEAKLSFHKVQLEAQRDGFEIKNFDKSLEELSRKYFEKVIHEEESFERGI